MLGSWRRQTKTTVQANQLKLEVYCRVAEVNVMDPSLFLREYHVSRITYHVSDVSHIYVYHVSETIDFGPLHISRYVFVLSITSRIYT